MDSLSLFIIAVSVILAVAFKWYLFQRIRNWIDQDLIKGLAAGDPVLLERLQRADRELRAKGTKRQQRHRHLEALAASQDTSALPGR